MAQFGENQQEAEVWDSLDRQFRAPLRAYFLRRLSDRSEAEDLTQEVFVRLTRNPDRNRGETIEAYVFKIASSVLGDWARRQKTRQRGAHQALNDFSENIQLPAILVEDRDPERVLAGKESLRDIEKSLGELSPRTREILLLSRLENVQYRDIAKLYGISVSAVEKHIVRALAHLSAQTFRP